MVDKVQIANTALREVGADRINSFEDGTYSADLISDIYEMVVEQVMIQGGWTSLRKRAALTRLAEPPVFGFKYAYIMPQTPPSISIIEFNRNRVENGIVIPLGRNTTLTRNGELGAFQLEGKYLLTNAEVAHVVYIAKDMNENNWGPHLRNTVVAALKLRIAKNQSAESGVVTQLTQEYGALLDDNRSRNNLQASSVEMETDTYFVDR